MALKDAWIETYTGVRFSLSSPSPDDVSIEDIAHSLAYQCRYNGHIREFYSVAEHSCHIHDLLIREGHRDQVAFAGLMHDSTEAYVGDLPAPLKSILPSYKVVEYSVWDAITVAFGLQLSLPQRVKELDRLMVLAERNHLKFGSDHDWGIVGEAPDIDIQCWGPQEAKNQFAIRFAKYRAVNIRNESGENMVK